MKAKEIIYERLVNTGNFSHEKYGIVVELENGETAQVAMDKAREFVDRQISKPSESDRETHMRVVDFDEWDIPF